MLQSARESVSAAKLLWRSLWLSSCILAHVIRAMIGWGLYQVSNWGFPPNLEAWPDLGIKVCTKKDTKFTGSLHYLWTEGELPDLKQNEKRNVSPKAFQIKINFKKPLSSFLLAEHEKVKGCTISSPCNPILIVSVS